jgi:flagellin-specific chaperone FliS
MEVDFEGAIEKLREIEKLIDAEEYGKAKLELRRFMGILDGMDYALSKAIRQKS